MQSLRQVGPAVGLLLCIAVALGAAADEPQRIDASDASEHVGEVAEVCGEVASAAYLPSVGGRPTFLNFERPYPDQVFTVVIWGRSRSGFDGRPEQLFDGKQVCVTGKITEHEGVPQIVVEDAEQIVLATPAAGGALGDLERVFVKAVLSSLGYDANYGTGEWDEEAIEAIVSFQEDAGVEPTGEADPATLRALADAAEAMPEAERDLVIRLLLFELARRQE
jgi:micrococcal nuclease